MRRVTILYFALLFGCSAQSDYGGEVVSYDGRMLTLSGPLNQEEGKPGLYPTPTMQQKATSICGGNAEFESVATSNPTSSLSTSSMSAPTYFNYNFICL